MLHTDRPVILVIGTRPEGIKMAPVYHALQRAGIATRVCSTMQHDHMLREVLELFGIDPDIELDVMRPGQDLFYLTQSILQKTKETFTRINPCLVLVQGDTTSSMAAALAAFYLGIPIGHVEAGLRTDDVHMPFPEEMNRRMISIIASYHFAPTPAAVANLLAHGVRRDQLFCTGNTVVDALHIIKEKLLANVCSVREDIASTVRASQDRGQQLILLTMHRRESLGSGIEDVLQTVKELLLARPDVQCVYPFHPNPRVVQAISKIGLHELPNMYLSEPVSYKEMVYLLDASDCVLTDSGGLQEEAVSLGKPVIVLREKTERMEGVLAGYAHVVGTDAEKIKATVTRSLEQDRLPSAKIAANVYGDGHAAEKIVAFVQARYEQLQTTKAEKKDIVPAACLPRESFGNTHKTVTVIGLGYIGLPTALMAADSGYKVHGVDIDAERVANINAGDPVIREPEIFERLQNILGGGQFQAYTSMQPADYFAIAVPTPVTKDNGVDLSYVWAAVDSIAPVLKKNNVVIVESTIPVGATDAVAQRLTEATGLQAGTDFYVAHCPERVLPGNIFKELVENDRIIGGINDASAQQAEKFYAPFVSGIFYLTDAKTAELVKLIENSSRDAQIAFAHQVAVIADKAGINPYTAINLANKHPRVNILRPTAGVGGHCIAVDPWFLVETFPKDTPFIRAARDMNDARREMVLARIGAAVQAHRQKTNNKPTIALLGLTYKPHVDDVRESPALYIAEKLCHDSLLNVRVCEPYMPYAWMKEKFGNRAGQLADIVSDADIVVFLVAHERFMTINPRLLESKNVLDFCGARHQADDYRVHSIKKDMDTSILLSAQDSTQASPINTRSSDRST